MLVPMPLAEISSLLLIFDIAQCLREMRQCLLLRQSLQHKTYYHPWCLCTDERVVSGSLCFFLWFSDQVPGNKECTSLQIETLLFMQEARSAASGVCSLDISSCFFYILHASCASCFEIFIVHSPKRPVASCFFFFEDRSFPSELLLVQRVPGFRSLCQGCRAPALSWDVWQMARC